MPQSGQNSRTCADDDDDDDDADDDTDVYKCRKEASWIRVTASNRSIFSSMLIWDAPTNALAQA